MYLNEDEIEKAATKLTMLMHCCKIKEMGFEYDEGECVILDLYASEGGYGGPAEYEIIESIIKPTLGYGSVTENWKIKDELLELGAEIPRSSFYEGNNGEDDIIGVTIEICNEYTKKLQKCGINDIQQFYKIITQRDWGLFYDESTVSSVQFFMEGSSVYIICPERYVCVEDFLYSYEDFLQGIVDTIYEHEKQLMNKEEVA